MPLSRFRIQTRDLLNLYPTTIIVPSSTVFKIVYVIGSYVGAYTDQNGEASLKSYVAICSLLAVYLRELTRAGVRPS